MNVDVWICLLLNLVMPCRSDWTLNAVLVCVTNQAWTIKIPTSLIKRTFNSRLIDTLQTILESVVLGTGIHASKSPGSISYRSKNSNIKHFLVCVQVCHWWLRWTCLLTLLDRWWSETWWVSVDPFFVSEHSWTAGGARHGESLRTLCLSLNTLEPLVEWDMVSLWGPFVCLLTLLDRWWSETW